jgi:hypothetical protein
MSAEPAAAPPSIGSPRGRGRGAFQMSWRSSKQIHEQQGDEGSPPQYAAAAAGSPAPPAAVRSPAISPGGRRGRVVRSTVVRASAVTALAAAPRPSSETFSSPSPQQPQPAGAAVAPSGPVAEPLAPAPAYAAPAPPGALGASVDSVELAARGGRGEAVVSPGLVSLPGYIADALSPPSPGLGFAALAAAVQAENAQRQALGGDRKASIALPGTEEFGRSYVLWPLIRGILVSASIRGLQKPAAGRRASLASSQGDSTDSESTLHQLKVSPDRTSLRWCEIKDPTLAAVAVADDSSAWRSSAISDVVSVGIGTGGGPSQNVAPALVVEFSGGGRITASPQANNEVPRLAAAIHLLRADLGLRALDGAAGASAEDTISALAEAISICSSYPPPPPVVEHPPPSAAELEDLLR